MGEEVLDGEELFAGVVSNAGLVVKVGEVLVLIGDAARVMWLGSESVPSGVTWLWIPSSGKSKWIPPSGTGKDGG